MQIKDEGVTKCLSLLFTYQLPQTREEFSSVPSIFSYIVIIVIDIIDLWDTVGMRFPCAAKEDGIYATMSCERDSCGARYYQGRPPYMSIKLYKRKHKVHNKTRKFTYCRPHTRNADKGIAYGWPDRQTGQFAQEKTDCRPWRALSYYDHDRIFHDHMKLLHLTITYKTQFYKLMIFKNCSRQIRVQIYHKMLLCFDR